MKIEKLPLESNTAYGARAKRVMHPFRDVTITEFMTVKFRTDEHGHAYEFATLLPTPSETSAEEAAHWDYLTLTNLETGVTVDYRLHIAASSGDVKMAREALSEGTDVHLRLAQGATALHWAAARGHIHVARLLIKHGADVNAVDDIDWTPLFLASQSDHHEMVVLLHRHGAKLSGVVQGRPVEITLHTELANEHDLALLDAAHEGDLDGVKRAHAAGGRVNCSTSDGWSPLLCAATSDPSVTRFLLDHDADPDVPSTHGYTPLMRAAGHGNKEVVQLLLAADADSTLHDCDGRTATVMAMEMHHTECAILCNPDRK